METPKDRIIENEGIPEKSVTNSETENMEAAETVQTEEAGKTAEAANAPETMEKAESVETTETRKTTKATESAAAEEAAKATESAETSETTKDTESAEAEETTEASKVREIVETTETEETKESIEIPSTTPVPEKVTNGNWGTVALIILLIIVAGAALAVILLRAKNKGRKGPYRRNEDQNTVAVVNPELSSASISCGMAQTIGKREQQQDSLYCSNWKDPSALLTRGMLAAVADGIGGLKDGNLASQSAMQAIRTTFLEGSPGESPSDRLLSCAAAAQKSVLKLNETSSCGATLVSVLITGKTMHFLSIGDSRIYLYRAGALLQLNREHTLRRENEEKDTLYGTGETLTRKRAGALTSYLGKSNLTQIDRSLQPMKLVPGDRIALMSDGVFNVLSEQEIMAHLRKSPEEAAREMIQDVDLHDHPSQDNATVVVIGIG